LLVSNTTGLGAGGPIQVNGGTLGGSGTVAGPVTVGTGTGAGAFLAPARGTKKQSTFTIQSSLTFKADSTYLYSAKTKDQRFALIWWLRAASRLKAARLFFACDHSGFARLRNRSHRDQ
jgi:hypothetical protein